MTPIACVFHEQTNLIRRYLRRFIFSSNGPCAHDFGDGYKRGCDAKVHLDDVVLELTDEGYIPSYEWDKGDGRWPRCCAACGREFPADDPKAPWQVHVDHLYKSSVTGELVALHELPVGAIWYQEIGVGPNSIHRMHREGLSEEMRRVMALPHILVRTPGGVWDMDTIATNGDGWQVTGEMPRITARPSIQHRNGGWHGWLTDGVLTQC